MTRSIIQLPRDSIAIEQRPLIFRRWILVLGHDNRGRLFQPGDLLIFEPAPCNARAKRKNAYPNPIKLAQP